METVTCARCGESMAADATICGYCGGRRAVPAASVAAVVAGMDPVIGATPSGGGTVGGTAGRHDGSDPFAEHVREVRLTVVGRGGVSRVVPLREGDLIQVGSAVGPLADLCTDNISRMHAELRVCSGAVEVVDRGTSGKGSTNGTFVNGRRIAPMSAVRVGDGDVVSLGADPPLTISVSMGAP